MSAGVQPNKPLARTISHLLCVGSAKNINPIKLQHIQGDGKLDNNKVQKLPRIIGIDVARAIAVIGMIIVNFKIVIGEEVLEVYDTYAYSFANLFEGKASATFVTLAGVGIALMTKSSLRTNNTSKLNINKQRIAKRALFLFVLGLSYMPIWSADILHFYGIYMLILLLFIHQSNKVILLATALIILVFPLLMLLINYETGWNFSTLEYSDFWQPIGFSRNLLYNGFHPVIPWVAFMLFGFWWGKQDLNDNKFIKKSLLISFIVFTSVQVFSRLVVWFLSEGSIQIADELNEVLGTEPMPPLPIYMINGIACAIAVTSLCILLSQRFADNWLTLTLVKTGQLALTFYIAHVLIGMGVIEVLYPQLIGKMPISFSVMYSLTFSLCCLLFAVIWTKFFKQGIMEWIMRKVAG